MNNFKGTPAPWFADGSLDGTHNIWHEEEGHTPILVARTCFKPTSYANSSLIAAAPELLDALQYLLESLNSYDENDPLAIQQAKSAINKALGL